MKKIGILNKQLSSEIAGVGHTDKILVCDVGFPIPNSMNRVDMALIKGIPSIMQTLQAVLSEIIVEKVIIAEETKEISPKLFKELQLLFCKQEFEVVHFSDFQRISGDVKFALRTGDVTPYANIILVAASGVNQYNRDFDLGI